MKIVRVLIVVVCLTALINFASADNIRGINIDFVTIGNAGNGTDPATGNLHGAVGYNYSIGKYEVTNAQWNAFTTAAGAPTGNDGSYTTGSYFTGAQQPTNNVSWYEAAQFCNYLTSGDKSKGAYQFSGNNTNPGSFIGIDRVSSISTYGTTYVLPTHDEWYKAAYYKPDGSGYSTYAYGTDTAPIAGVQSNHNDVIGKPWDVGTGTIEQNGTYDMMGNVWEWNETLFTNYSDGDVYRGARGGSFTTSGHDYYLASSWLNGRYPEFEHYSFGFRVAEIPEPCSLVLLSLGGLALLGRRRK
ncbi:MAG: SUMF1/EgtB/PvdO family nonheme iron enzyme [Sedimentisphaerales bacterium]